MNGTEIFVRYESRVLPRNDESLGSSSGFNMTGVDLTRGWRDKRVRGCC